MNVAARVAVASVVSFTLAVGLFALLGDHLLGWLIAAPTAVLVGVLTATGPVVSGQPGGDHGGAR